MQNAEVKILHFTDLHAWQKGHELALEIYKITKKFPDDERFGLTSQMRRSSTSFTANIAEGFGRQTQPDKHQFFVIARGSNIELQDQLIMAYDLDYIDHEKYSDLIELAKTVNKIVKGLIRSMNR